MATVPGAHTPTRLHPRLSSHSTPEGVVAKARYYGLASGGANQLPAAAARAFTPPPLRRPTVPPSVAHPSRRNYLSPARRCQPGTPPPAMRMRPGFLCAGSSAPDRAVRLKRTNDPPAPDFIGASKFE
ncbi:unnamed protein product, partial [Iphiclides podalirius]